MALTDRQKADVIYFLGWPAKTLVANSTNYNKITADRLENLTAVIESQVDKLLDKLRANEERLESAQDRLTAKKVDDIELNDKEIDMLRGERARLCKLLSRLLDIPVAGGSGIMFGVRI